MWAVWPASTSSPMVFHASGSSPTWSSAMVVMRGTLRRRVAELPRQERQYVGQLVGLLQEWLALAVTGPALLAQQDRSRVAARRGRLQGGRHLAGVQRVDAGVALRRGEQDRRVARARLHVVVRRVRPQPLELLGHVRV